LDALGTHLLMELQECESKLLDDIAYVEQIVVGAALHANANILGKFFHKFSPHGVTGIVSIAESHISIHTWPEFRYAAADIFTCGKSLKPKLAAEFLIEHFNSNKPHLRELKRGRIPNTASTPLTAIEG